MLTKSKQISFIGVVLLLLCSSCKKKDPRIVTLTEEEKNWLPYHIGDTIRFKSDLDSIETWVVIEKSENDNLKQGPWGRGTRYISDRFLLKEIVLNQTLSVSYGFETKDDPYLALLYKGKGISSNVERDTDGFKMGKSNLTLFENREYYFLFTKNEGLTSYKTDSQQVYEKY